MYTPPNPKFINKLLSDLIEFLNVCDPTIINLAILHYQFESIHPYYDGNGRVGRILNILYLILKKMLDSPILYLSSYIIKSKNDYYKKLNAVTAKEKWDDWIMYVLEGVKTVSRDTITKMNLLLIKLG